MNAKAILPLANENSRNSANLLQRKCACGNSGVLDEECESCRNGLYPGLQRKLMIGKSDDPLEHEADRVAAQILATPDPSRMRTGRTTAPRISRRISSTTMNNQPYAPESEVQVLKTAGEPLSMHMRSYFEPRFGHDFGSVRIHRDGNAAKSALAVNAQAFTVGQHIVFAASQYQPETPWGRSLLAHELTHTIQQDSHEASVLSRRVDDRGFFANIGRALAGFFTGSEPDYADQVLLDYLQLIDRTNEIENDFDSDNKARFVVDRWRSGSTDFSLTARLKTLLIKEMLSGATFDSDENAILALLSDSPDSETIQILDSIGIERLNDKFDGIQQRRLDRIIADHRQRVVSGAASLERSDISAANVGSVGIERELRTYLRYIDTHDAIRVGSDSHRLARELVERWANGDQRYDLPPRRKQLLVKELLTGAVSQSDRDATLLVLRSVSDVELRMIGRFPGKAWILARIGASETDAVEGIFTTSFDRTQAEADQRSQDDQIKRIVVDQEIPQTVTIHWKSGATESDLCSTGKGHCCVDEDDLEGATCSADESSQGGSNCTPLGTHKVAFTLPNNGNHPDYWTEFHDSRDIALHQYTPVDGTPLSHGCVRLHEETARKIHEGVRPRKTDVVVRGLARPRCDWPNLQAEWSNDFVNANYRPADGEQPDARRLRSVKRQRSTFREIFDLNDTGLRRMLQQIEAETRQLTAELNDPELNRMQPVLQELSGGLYPRSGILGARNRPSAFAAIEPVVTRIPRCVATQTVEESRLGNHPEPVKILSTAGFDQFAADFERELRMARTMGAAEQVITRHGNLLWQASLSVTRKASEQVETPDDRPLYWARLQMTRSLRQWTPRWYRSRPGSRKIGTTDDIRRDKAHLLARLERVSRGMAEADFTAPAGTKRILISGFDPFGLNGEIDRSNPSGAAVLALDNRTLTSTSGVDAQVQGVIFPVRFADFEQGIVEEFFSPFINRSDPPDMIMTISQGRSEFEIEEFAGRRRSSGAFRDNVDRTSGGTLVNPVEPEGLAAGPEFTRSSLPRDAIRESLGRNSPSRGETEITQIREGETRPVRSESGPATGATAVRGSGGGFLSNEIFYRTSRIRDLSGNSIPLGHLHTPSLPPESTDARFEELRTSIVERIESILKAAIDAI